MFALEGTLTPDPRHALQAFGCLETGNRNNICPRYQHAHPSLSLSKWMSIGSEKSPLYSSDSSCASAFLAITVKSVSLHHNTIVVQDNAGTPSKACSTFTASLALVSKYGIPPFDWQNVIAFFEEIILLFSSTSILLPSTTFPILSVVFDTSQRMYPRKGNSQGLADWLVSGIRLSSYPECRNSSEYWRHRLVRSSRHLCRRQRPVTETVLGPRYPTTIWMSAASTGSRN